MAMAVALLLSPLPTLANDKKEAGKLFKEGNELRLDGKYEEALSKYEAAYKLFPSFKIEFNTALTLGHMGNNVEAYRAYKSFLEKGTGQSPEKMLRMAKENMNRLKQAIALVALKCAEDGAVVYINGADHGTTPIAGDMALIPGETKISVKAPEHEEFTRTLVLKPGQVVTINAELKSVTLELPFLNREVQGKNPAAISSAESESSDDDAKVAAATLNREGNNLRRLKQYEAALAKYTEARLIFPDCRIDYNAALTYEKLDRLVEAANGFGSFLARVGKDAPERSLKSARQRLKVLNMIVGRVELSCNSHGATVFVDGEKVGRTPIDRDIYMEPGSHKIEVRQSGYKRHRKNIKVATGQRVGVDVQLVELPSIVARRDARRKGTILAWSGYGLGAASLVTAAILYGVGLSSGNKAHDEYRNSADWDEYYAHRQEIYDAERLLVAGHIMTGVALAAAGAATYFYLTRPEKQERNSTGLQSLGAAPMGTSGGGMVICGGF